MTDSIISLGGYRFGADTASIQQLSRDTEYSWEAQALVGRRDAHQYTGDGRDEITIPCLVFPAVRGGSDQAAALRDLARQARPLSLVTGNGDYLGEWIIVRISETRTAIVPGGGARQQELSITLRRYDSA